MLTYCLRRKERSVLKVLVIPDVHLKPWMFERAAEIMKTGVAEKAVCLMDIPDEWNQELNLDLYMQTFDAAIRSGVMATMTSRMFGSSRKAVFRLLRSRL